MQIHLVDGTYELFRAHFGSLRSGRKGPAPGVAGLLRALVKLLSRSDVTHVACAFDNPIESFRNSLFSGYKTSAGVPQELLVQFDLAEQATRALGVVTWSMDEVEADDALATAAARFGGVGQRVVLCSPDKDLMQCVRGQEVVCWDSLRDRVYDEAAVRQKFGVAPSAIADLLALVGDSADGIPGVPRWGLKSSAALLRAHGSLEAIPKSLERWQARPRGAPALLETLTTHFESALLYKRLATLRRDVPLSLPPAGLRYAGPNRAALARVCAQLEDDFALNRAASL